jgi:hypothetical protein
MSQTREKKHELLKKLPLTHSHKRILKDEKNKGITHSSSVVIQSKISQHLINVSKKASTVRKHLKQHLLKKNSRDLFSLGPFEICVNIIVLLGLGLVVATMEPLLSIIVVSFSLGVIGCFAYDFYQFSKLYSRFNIKIYMSAPYKTFLTNDEQELIEAECKELKLEIQPINSTRDICNQLFRVEERIAEQLKPIREIENVFDCIESSIGLPRDNQLLLRNQLSLFSRQHPAREIVLSYLFSEPKYTGPLPQAFSQENSSDDEDNGTGSPLPRNRRI